MYYHTFKHIKLLKWLVLIFQYTTVLIDDIQILPLTTGIKPTPSTASILPSPTPQPPNQITKINGNLDTFVISSSKDPAQDGKLNWRVRLPSGTDAMQAIAFFPGLTIPYAWIGAMEYPAKLPDGLDLVGSSSFTSTVILTFDSGEMATVLHSSPGVSLNELSFSAERNGSFPEGIELDQLLPISLILERVSDGTVRALGSRNGVQVTFTLRYTPNGIQFPLLNLTLEASATDTSVDPLDESTVLTFSTTSRLSEVPIQTIGGSITGRTDDGVVLPTARVTAYADRLRDGQLNWEIADLPGTNDVGSYRPLLPAIALSAAWLNAQETPERLMDGREATGDGRIQATIIIQYPQGQTLTLQSTSTGLSPEQPDRLLFDVVVSGSYPADNELSIGQTLSVPLQQTALGVLSGQQNLEQGIIISLTITYQPLAPQAVPATLLLLQLTPAEVDTTGQTSTIKFSAVAELQLIQLTTVVAPIATPTTSATPAVVPTFSPTPKPTPTPPAQVDRLNGSLDSLAVSASRDPTQDGKLHWNVRLPPGTDPSQVIAFLPGLTIPYAWIGAMERPTELPDGLDLVGSSSFTSSVVLIFESGEMATVLHSSQGISLSEFSFSAKRNGSVPAGILLDQLFPISLILERTSDRTVQALGFMDSVQVTFTLSYTPSGIQFPLLNLTLEASAADTSMNPLDGSTVLTFSTTSRLSEVPIQTLGGSITGRLAPDLLLPVARITVLVVGDSNGQLNWNISELSDPNALDLYQVLYPAIVLSVSWLHAEGHSGQLKDGQEVTGNGQFTAVLHVRFASGHILTVNSTSHGFSIEEPKVSVLEVVISGNYPSNADLSSMQFLSLVLEQSGIGLLSGRQLASQDLHIDLTIAFIPLNPDNIPRSIMSVQLSAAEVAATGSTFSIHFGSRAVLSLFQPPSITIDLLPSTTVAASSTSVSSSLPLPTPTPPDQEMLLRGAVKGAALPTLEIIAQRDLQLSSRLEWIVRNFSILEELELYRSLLPFIPLSAALLADGKQFKIITGETEMNLIIIVELSPGRTLRVETSSSVQSSGYLFHQIEFSGSYPTISEVTSFYSISMMIKRNERGYVSGEQVLQGGHRISIQSNYLPSDFSPEDTFLLTAMTHSPEARGLSFVMSSISMFKATLGMLSSSISSVIPTSKAALSTGIANISSVAVSSPRPPPPLPPVCKFHLYYTTLSPQSDIFLCEFYLYELCESSTGRINFIVL